MTFYDLVERACRYRNVPVNSALSVISDAPSMSRTRWTTRGQRPRPITRALIANALDVPLSALSDEQASVEFFRTAPPTPDGWRPDLSVRQPRKDPSFLMSAIRNANLTLPQVADSLGLAHDTVARWRNGNKFPNDPNFMELSRLLDIPYHTLLDGCYPTASEQPSSPAMDPGDMNLNTTIGRLTALCAYRNVTVDQLDLPPTTMGHWRWVDQTTDVRQAARAMSMLDLPTSVLFDKELTRRFLACAPPTPSGWTLRRDRPDPKPDGKLLLDIRARAGLTQPEMAEKLHVHWSTIYNWETNNKFPSGRHLPLLAAISGMPFADFIDAYCPSGHAPSETPGRNGRPTPVTKEANEMTQKETQNPPAAGRTEAPPGNASGLIDALESVLAALDALENDMSAVILAESLSRFQQASRAAVPDVPDATSEPEPAPEPPKPTAPAPEKKPPAASAKPKRKTHDYASPLPLRGDWNDRFIVAANIMREKNVYRLNNRQIAEMAGISDNLVAAVLQGRPNTSIENYVAVAKTLGCLAEVEAVVRGQIPSA